MPCQLRGRWELRRGKLESMGDHIPTVGSEADTGAAREARTRAPALRGPDRAPPLSARRPRRALDRPRREAPSRPRPPPSALPARDGARRPGASSRRVRAPRASRAAAGRWSTGALVAPSPPLAGSPGSRRARVGEGDGHEHGERPPSPRRCGSDPRVARRVERRWTALRPGRSRALRGSGPGGSARPAGPRPGEGRRGPRPRPQASGKRGPGQRPLAATRRRSSSRRRGPRALGSSAAPPPAAALRGRSARRGPATTTCVAAAGEARACACGPTLPSLAAVVSPAREPVPG